MFLSIFQSFFMFSYVSCGESFPEQLKPEEENYYLKELEKGSVEAKNILIERNLRLVAHIVKKYSSKNYDTDDLISIGTIGLIKAVMTYNMSKGFKLVTYASRCIENEILMSFRVNKKYSKDVSLQDTIGLDKDGNEVTLQDKIADDGMSIDEEAWLKIQIKLLYEKIKLVLKDRERTIIELRYGIATGEEVTQKEIAKNLGISRSYVSRIEKRALEKLSKVIEK